MDITRWLGAVEALLFASGCPIRGEEIAGILGLEAVLVKRVLEELGRRYVEDSTRGIYLEEVAGGYQLVTKPIYAVYLQSIGRPVYRGGLSQAALEVLAIVAYRQPVTRAEIDAIRGVRSDSVIGLLLERGLVQEVGRRDGPGRPALYGTTEEFLVQMGLSSLEDLPPLPEDV